MSLIHRPSSTSQSRALDLSTRYGPDATEAVREGLRLCPAHKRTPICALSDLAAGFGVASLWAKDERDRMGLANFKALGGAFAVLTAGMEEATGCGTGRDWRYLLSEGRSPCNLIFTTATAGNHGRSVAAGAALLKARCVVFVCAGTPPDQVDAITRHGAEVVRVAEDYDQTVAVCADQARRNSWTLIADTATGTDDGAVARVMQGYTVIASEILSQFPVPPTHVFLQAGVGGFAAALTAYFACTPEPRPSVVVVESDMAACLQASVRSGALVRTPPHAPTSTGRLDCRTPSTLALRILQGLAAAFIEVSDSEAEEAARLLRSSGLGTTPSGAAGLAGVIRAVNEPELKQGLQLDQGSRIVVVLTEAPTLVDSALAA